MTYGGCPPLPHVNRDGVSWDGSPWRCDQFFAKSLARLRNPHVQTIVVAAAWEDWLFGLERFHSTNDPAHTPLKESSVARKSVMDDFAKTIAELEKSGKRVYIVLSAPFGEAFDPAEMLPQRFPGFPNRKRVDSVPRAEAVAASKKSDRILRDIAARTGATVIDPLNSFCDQSACGTIDADGNPRYRDAGHIRASYARDHATFLDVTGAR
jgi:hypothetical protein